MIMIEGTCQVTGISIVGKFIFVKAKDIKTGINEDKIIIWRLINISITFLILSINQYRFISFLEPQLDLIARPFSLVILQKLIL